MEIQQRDYEWMVKLTPQREWIEGPGIILILAMYFGMGAGLYLISSFFNSLLGMFVGLLIVDLLFGGLHLAYLGRPLRFWRMIFRPQTSWISRGLIFVLLLNITGVIEIAMVYWQIQAEVYFIPKVLAAIFAVLTCIYTGFVMNYVRAIPFWNNGLLPILIVVHEILGGFGIALIIAHIPGAKMDIIILENGARLLLIISVLLLTIYLWSSTYSMQPGPESVKALLRGPKSFSLPFWVGVVLLGIILPLIISLISYGAREIALPLLFGGIVCELLGGLALRYCLMKSAFYAPLLPL